MNRLERFFLNPTSNQMHSAMQFSSISSRTAATATATAASTTRRISISSATSQLRSYYKHHNESGASRRSNRASCTQQQRRSIIGNSTHNIRDIRTIMNHPVPSGSNLSSSLSSSSRSFHDD